MCERNLKSLWTCGEIKAFLLDITGVLYNSGQTDGGAIPGSIDAVRRLRENGIPVRFVTNETTCLCKDLVKKLQSFGFELTENEVFSPAPAVKAILKDRGLRPFLLVTEEAAVDYADLDQHDPNCVVLADATENFSYQNMNEAFQILMNSVQPVLFSLGIGKYYKHNNKLQLDVGAYTKALEFATGVEAEIVGKPSSSFFQSALRDLNLPAKNVVMVGDDIVNDVGGAQACGIHGVQVRTGKFRPEDENHASVKPDDIVDNLAQAVDNFLQGRS